MKRYGDNLPSKDSDEPVYRRPEAVEVIRGGCCVRYGMLDFLLETEIPKKRGPLKIFSLFKFGRKKIRESDKQIPIYE